jgi:hypothetical protein
MKSEKTKSNPKVLLETIERIPEVKARLILPIAKPDARNFLF